MEPNDIQPNDIPPVEKLPDTQVPDAFYKTLKTGIYKELYQRGLISQQQLDALIKRQSAGTGVLAEFDP